HPVVSSLRERETMATVPRTRKKIVHYPTTDGKPMAETDVHRDDMVDVIQTLRWHFAGDPAVYVSGNLLFYYKEGDKRKHVSPDVFLVFGVGNHKRDYYLLWVEKKVPSVVIEITSKSTRKEDQETKFKLYQDVLKVYEYFLFDPYGDYLDPPLKGYRLYQGHYVPIKPVKGRLPSKVLGLHLERVGNELRLYDPAAGKWLPTPAERTDQAEAARQQAEAARQQAETARPHEAEARP